MLHRIQKHPEPVEGCFGCKVLTLELNTGDVSSRVPMSTRKWDNELQAYRDVRAQGIQPASTRLKDIHAAEAASNHFGKAYQADQPGKGVI